MSARLLCCGYRFSLSTHWSLEAVSPSPGMGSIYTEIQGLCVSSANFVFTLHIIFFCSILSHFLFLFVFLAYLPFYIFFKFLLPLKGKFVCFFHLKDKKMGCIHCCWTWEIVFSFGQRSIYSHKDVAGREPNTKLIGR